MEAIKNICAILTSSLTPPPDIFYMKIQKTNKNIGHSHDIVRQSHNFFSNFDQLCLHQYWGRDKERGFVASIGQVPLPKTIMPICHHQI